VTDNLHRDDEPESEPSCAPGLSRKEFLTTVVKKASLVGALAAAPMMVDAFLAPSASANPSDVTDCSTDPSTDPASDTIIPCSPNSG
jgi:hypothetical protein